MNDLIEIYAAHESGVSGSWEWVVSMSSNQDGTYRLVIDQVLWDSDEDAEPATYELTTFNTGEQLFQFLQSTWQEEHCEGLEERDWQDIETNIRKFDENLADQVNHESEKQALIQRCVEGATWEQNLRAGRGAMWAAIADRPKMIEAVSSYVRDYYALKECVPEGEHQVQEKIVTFPKK